MTWHCWYGQHRNFAHTQKKNLLRNFKSLKRKKNHEEEEEDMYDDSDIPIRYAVVRYMPLAK